MTAPETGAPFITLVRVAVAWAALTAANLPTTNAHLLFSLGGGSKRTLTKCLNQLGIVRQRPAARPLAQVPPAAAACIRAAIADVELAGLPLRHRDLCARTGIRSEFVSAILQAHRGRRGPTPVRSSARATAQQVDEETCEFVMLDEEWAPTTSGSGTAPSASRDLTDDQQSACVDPAGFLCTGSGTTRTPASPTSESQDILDGIITVHANAATNGSGTIHRSPASMARASEWTTTHAPPSDAPEAFGQEFLSDPNISTQVTSQCDCKAMYTPPAFGRRGDPPTPTPAPHQAAEGWW